MADLVFRGASVIVKCGYLIHLPLLGYRSDREENSNPETRMTTE